MKYKEPTERAPERTYVREDRNEEVDEVDRNKDEQENPVIMEKGSHLYPSRTQKLSPSSPKIPGGRLPGKIGHCRLINKKHSAYAGCFFIQFC